MTTTTAAPAPGSGHFDLQSLEKAVAKSRLFALVIIFGLPALGVFAALFFELPLFAAMMAGSFLLATGLVCHRAIATFTGKTLRLLVAARIVIILVLASLLFVATGAEWAALVSAVLLWLVADRLLGRRALYDLYKLVRSRP